MPSALPSVGMEEENLPVSKPDRSTRGLTPGNFLPQGLQPLATPPELYHFLPPYYIIPPANRRPLLSQILRQHLSLVWCPLISLLMPFTTALLDRSIYSLSLLPYFTVSPQHIPVKFALSISLKCLLSRSPTTLPLPHPTLSCLSSPSQ